MKKWMFVGLRKWEYSNMHRQAVWSVITLLWKNDRRGWWGRWKSMMLRSLNFIIWWWKFIDGPNLGSNSFRAEFLKMSFEGYFEGQGNGEARKGLRKILQWTRQEMIMVCNEQREWRQMVALANYIRNWISGIWVGSSTQVNILCT